MFTGIVEETGAITTVGNNSLTVQGKVVLEGTRIGDSIAVNGACLTVIDLSREHFTVEIMPETKRLTNLGSVRAGDIVNLERALPVTGRFGGHFVQGHVDGMGKIKSVENDGEGIILNVGVSEEIARYLVKKGYIAVNGVSLTIIECSGSQFAVSLVGFTMQSTNLGKARHGNFINLEVDIIAKYMEKFYHPYRESRLISLLDQYDYLKER